MIIYQKIFFDAAHRLLGYEGNCKNLHGHTWMVEVWLEAPIGSNGMVCDYRAIKEYFKNNWDHRTLLNADDPLGGTLAYIGLPFAVVIGNPTAENIALKIKSDLRAKRVVVHESPKNYADAQ